MAKVKKTTPKYKDGDKVKTTMSGDKLLIVKGEPQWNGLTWMYAFRGDTMRLGEMYVYPETKTEN